MWDCCSAWSLRTKTALFLPWCISCDQHTYGSESGISPGWLSFSHIVSCAKQVKLIFLKGAALSILSDKWSLVPCEKASAVGLQAYDLHAEGRITFSHKEHPDVTLQSQGSYMPYSVPLALQQEVYVLFHEQLMCNVQKNKDRVASCNQTFQSGAHCKTPWSITCGWSVQICIPYE